MAKRGRGRRRAGAKRLFPRVGKIVLLVLVLLINAIAIILRNRYARKW